MSFWRLEADREAIALVAQAGDETWTYGRLAEEVTKLRTSFLAHPNKRLGFLFTRNAPEALAGYLAALQAEDAVCLLDPGLNESLQATLVSLYEPDWFWAPSGALSPAVCVGYVEGPCFGTYQAWQRKDNAARVIHPALAVLLPTSGTTGSPKLVRLSYDNLQANAQSIATYLGLDQYERPITTLPMHYSYGLSVLNSHLLAGSTLLLTEQSLVSREFWAFFRAHGATSLAGVPYTYQMLQRLRLERMELPSLRVLTQAGGRLDPASIEHFACLAEARNWRFFVMYGQTEATARISYVPPGEALRKAGSIGLAIPGGKLMLDQETGELIYQGANVMMGYAETSSDLAKGDELAGVLRTGDLARIDSEGYHYITGRTKRFIKLFGLRIGLDDVERVLEQAYGVPIACVGDDEQLIVMVEGDEDPSGVKATLTSLFKIAPSACKIVMVPTLPRSASGKIDYPMLKELVLP